ncbi:C40 family peptidase [Paenibacillus algorifonticola]|uniref:Hydrolase n=1 Tax=Paenibacillus sp. BIHB 4019 TaxID=1870819 RepID=A0A1B2DFB3_9BACL|nr:MULTISPECIES: C40 family peptidase [unclassified Paenibacillus]ANY66408.1 hydrolase [Paenibacillus sp. BIHB 4019]KQO13779.1 hydrolase [Paenibacillus sp. Leaf72]
MLKKVTALLVGLVLMLAFQAGSVFASSKMDGVIADLIGTPYQSGGTTTKGFDCSGFTKYVFDKMGIDLSRTSQAQSNDGSEVKKSDLIAGDLVFFNTSGKGISHVGIYVGDGKFAHASSSRGVIISKLSESYYADRYVSATRVMSQDAYDKYASEQ